MLIDKKVDITSEQKILQAAEEEFMLCGYDGAKTTSIAKRANVTHAMLHYYFRTKENLFNQVFQKKSELMAQSLTQIMMNYNGNVIEYIQSIIEIHFDFIAANPDLPRFVVNELISKPERQDLIAVNIKGVISTAIPKLQNILDDAHANGITRKINVYDLLIDIISLNVFAFIAKPLIINIVSIAYGSDVDWIAARKKENIEVIMSRILINKNQQ